MRLATMPTDDTPSAMAEISPTARGQRWRNPMAAMATNPTTTSTITASWLPCRTASTTSPSDPVESGVGRNPSIAMPGSSATT